MYKIVYMSDRTRFQRQIAMTTDALKERERVRGARGGGLVLGGGGGMSTDKHKRVYGTSSNVCACAFMSPLALIGRERRYDARHAIQTSVVKAGAISSI